MPRSWKSGLALIVLLLFLANFSVLHLLHDALRFPAKSRHSSHPSSSSSSLDLFSSPYPMDAIKIGDLPSQPPTLSYGTSAPTRRRETLAKSTLSMENMRTEALPKLWKDSMHTPSAAQYNPGIAQLRNGDLLVYARLSTSNMCLGFKHGKYREPRRTRHAIVGRVLNGTTLNPKGESFFVRVPRRTQSGGDLRCDVDSAAVGLRPLGAAHLQDIRLFWLGDRLLFHLLVMNCQHIWAYSNARQYLGEVNLTTLQPMGPLLRVGLNGTVVERTSASSLRKKFADRAPLQKNWMPLSPGNYSEIPPFMEYHFEPRVVLGLDTLNGEGVRVSVHAVPITSNPELFMMQQRWGTQLRGSVPAIHLPEHRDGAYITLAHIARHTRIPQYEHLWVVFSSSPPFRVLGFSDPFLLPTLSAAHGGRAVFPPVQFATGLVLLPSRKTLLVAYGESDCNAGVARVPLAFALQVAAEHGGSADDGTHGATVLFERHRNRTASDSLVATSLLLVGGKRAHEMLNLWTRHEVIAARNPGGYIASQCASACVYFGDACSGFVASLSGVRCSTNAHREQEVTECCVFFSGPASDLRRRQVAPPPRRPSDLFVKVRWNASEHPSSGGAFSEPPPYRFI